MPRQTSSRKSDKPYKAQANLEVLFGEEETQTSPKTLKLDAITLPNNQPRRYFDPQKLEQLTESVKAHGILENLLIRPVEGKEGVYELVAGERRYRAAKAAGLEEVPVTLRELSDEQALEISLVENLQREDLNPVEETEAILQLLASRLQIPVSEVSSRLYQMQNARTGKITNNVISNSQSENVQQVFTELGLMSWESFVSNRLPLLKLPEEVLEALRRGEIEYTKAKEIAKVKDEKQRETLLEEGIKENLSLSQIRERIKALHSESPPFHSPKTQIQTLTRRLNQSKLWEKDSKKWKRVQGWLQKIEALLNLEHLEEVAGLSQASLDPSEVEPDEEKIVGISKATLEPIFDPVEPLIRVTKLELAKKIGIAPRTLDNRINQTKKEQKTRQPIIEHEGQQWQYVSNPNGAGKIFELIQ